MADPSKIFDLDGYYVADAPADVSDKCDAIQLGGVIYIRNRANDTFVEARLRNLDREQPGTLLVAFAVLAGIVALIALWAAFR